GSRPQRPDLPGIDGPDVFGVQTLDDAAILLDAVRTKPRRAVTVVGAGYIGLEMAEAFVRRGARVTLLDGNPLPMRSFDPDMGARIASAVRHFGIDLRSSTS